MLKKTQEAEKALPSSCEDQTFVSSIGQAGSLPLAPPGKPHVTLLVSTNRVTSCPGLPRDFPGVGTCLVFFGCASSV